MSYDQTITPFRKVIPYEPHMNWIINGDFRVSQRGVYTGGQTLTTSNIYYLDRWKGSATGITGTLTHITPSGVDASKAMRLSAAGSVESGGWLTMFQPIEEYYVLVGKEITLSYMYKSNKDARIRFYSTGGGGQDYYSSPQTGTGNETWQQIVWHYTVPTGINSFSPCLGWNNTDIADGTYCEITNVKLEIGYQATPYIPRMLGQELVLCQRYYEKNTGAYSSCWNAPVTTGNNYRYAESFKVEKYQTPTMTYIIGAVSGYPATNPMVISASTSAFCCYMTSNLTVVTGYFFFNWTAEAEL